MSEHAKRMKRELVMKGTILDVYKDTMELPNGKTEEWDFVSHRKGAAAVVAVREDGKLLMVRQYRNALERMTLEIPAGARDSVTEDTKVCAARELEEETGYRSENLSFLLSLRTTVAFCDEFIDVYKDTMELPNGKTEEWDFVSHRKGAAAVVAVRADGKLLMVRQYRNALERMTLEIPAGARDSVTEDTRVCAARELEEETGYRSENLTFLLSLRTTVAFCDEFIDVYLARDLVKSAQHLDEGEAIDVEAHDVDELCEMIYAGKIQDSKTVSAILAYKNLLNKDSGKA